jgi:hypothetical protein
MATIYDIDELQKENNRLKSHLRYILEFFIDPHNDLRGEGYYEIIKYCENERLIIQESGILYTKQIVSEDLNDR